MRGMHGIKTAVDQNKAQGFIRYFRLGDGETTQVLFISSADKEPFIVQKHSYRDGKKFGGVIHRDEECVACYANTNGDKRVGRIGARCCFSMFDLGWVKKKLDKKRTQKDGKERFEYSPIEEDEVTRKAIDKGIVQRRGLCGWEMPSQWAQALGAIDAEERKRCKSCLKGKISVIKYLNAKGKPVSLADKEPEEIDELIASGKVTEKIKCNKCEKPKRMTIFNSIVAITRSGKDTSTTYQFRIVPDDIPKDVRELFKSDKAPEAYNWEEMMKQPSPARQAQELGIRNPFGQGGRDDDEATDYDEDDDDDDDTLLMSSSKKKKKKNKADDDDDDDDDSDVFGEDAEDDDEEDSEDEEEEDEDDESADDDDEEEDDDADDDDDKPKKKKSKVKLKKKAGKTKTKLKFKR